MLGSLGWEELLIILVILALLFGASRVADLGGALGRGIREFRQRGQQDRRPHGREGQGGAISGRVHPHRLTLTHARDGIRKNASCSVVSVGKSF